MFALGCLWNRSRLEAYADGALEGRPARAVSAHVASCAACRDAVGRLTQLRQVVLAGVDMPPEPDWDGFWPAVRQRIAREPGRPVRESWWLPLWTPIWGHPRLATVSAAVAALLLAFSFWPGGEGEVPVAWAGPVLVQEASAADPEGSVMIYSTAERDVTVIWVFAPDAP